MTQKFEYRVVPHATSPTEAWLNREGADGWQLVTVVADNPTKADTAYKVIFTRPLPESAANESEPLYQSSYRPSAR